MRKMMMSAIAAMALLAAVPSANAQERTITGAAIGAGAGAVVAGPVGAIAGGVIGATVGGPRISRTKYRRNCWRNSRGVRRCRR